MGVFEDLYLTGPVEDAIGTDDHVVAEGDPTTVLTPLHATAIDYRVRLDDDVVA